MDIKTIPEKIEKKRLRIEQLQKEIKALEEKQVQLENEQILKVCRQAQIRYADLNGILNDIAEGRLIYAETKPTGNQSEYQGNGTHSEHISGDYQANENQSDI